MRSHTLTHKMTTLHIFLDGELAVGWWQPGLRRQSPWRVQTSLKNSVYINMHIFIIHQCFALLAAGPRPHGSMSSLPCSFVWHGCRCFEREIKLVSVAAKTYMVVGVARTKITLTSWEHAWGGRYSWETEVFASWGQWQESSALFPHWWSLRKGWQIGALVAAFCNWVLRREDLHVEIGCRVFLHELVPCFHFLTPMWGHLHDFHTNRLLQKTFDLNLLDGMKAYLVILMKRRWILSPILQNEACSISDVLWIPGAGYNELICIWMHGWADEETQVFTLSRCVFPISYNCCKAVLDMEIFQMKEAGQDLCQNVLLLLRNTHAHAFIQFKILTC